MNSDLLRETLALHRELEALNAENQITRKMWIEGVRRLQASPTSIEAAVSSQLSYDLLEYSRLA